MISAIEVLNTFDKQKIAILGDVLELGEYARVSHETVGQYISEHPVDCLLTFGKDSEFILNKAVEQGYKNYACHFENINDLYASLENLIEGKVVLVKGSFGMGMTRIVDYLGGKHGIINC
jgi:UDP-N-acetylmuramoyl-tripeptide--D-alanyl-D-alanine ligase